MATDERLTERLRPDQKIEVSRAKELRGAAIELRSRISHGSYGDEELDQFWEMAGNVGLYLSISNPEIAERAGLGANFFSSVVRDRRRPKLANFLKALTAMIDVADERLFDIETREVKSSGAASDRPFGNLLIERERSQLLLMAASLARMARNEIEGLDGERPNDPSSISRIRKQLEILEIFANGFEQIADALGALDANPTEPFLLGKASKIVSDVGNQINNWWKTNGPEAVDWGMRIPFFVAGVSMLGWVGRIWQLPQLQ
jgi:hypothetical protein